jgi:hypothetical protein
VFGRDRGVRARLGAGRSLPSGAPVVPQKLFTLEEANAQLPQLRLLMERLQRAALRLDAEMHDLARTRGAALAALDLEELLRVRPALRLVVEEIDATVDRIGELGGQLKDVRLGLVDFPSLRNGQTVLLCWQFGEDAVAYWHREDEGFAGRRRLPGVAAVQRLQ